MQFKYLRKGQGPVLVLQHGFLCGTAYWQAQLEYFSRYFDVIAPALPGFGDHSNSTVINRIEGFADYVVGLMDQLQVARFHLLGHSMGGMIAQQVALQAGDRIEQLILYGTGPLGAMPGRFETLSQSAARIREKGIGDTIENTVSTWFVQGRSDPNYAATVETASKADLAAVLAGYEAMNEWRSLEMLDQISNQTRIIWGDADQSYRREQVELLLAGIPNCELVVMPGCSHNAHLETPERFNKILNEFLRDRVPGG